MKILPHSDINNFCVPCCIYFIYFHIFYFPWRFIPWITICLSWNLEFSIMGRSTRYAIKERNLPIHQVRDAVAILNAQELITKKNKLLSRQKKLKACDLSSLTEFLPALKPPRQSKPVAEFKLNSKTRQKLILKEGKRLSMVLNHQAFQADALGSIHQHC
ncbi:uncharacterized protein LOC133678405 [Populus nigra]|uniref:uncharacterized protein LOC133678405 n=1 Tax=Populus nigra TaxID=3691 RepID=UPI002B27547F|nr:uncharacterized protein LOC133678405 [Populus nigra]